MLFEFMAGRLDTPFGYMTNRIPQPAINRVDIQNSVFCGHPHCGLPQDLT